MNKNKNFQLLVGLWCFISPAAFASTAHSTIESFAHFAIGVAFLLGVIVFGNGLYGLYKVSDAQAPRETVSSCIYALIAGSALLALPEIYNMIAVTIYGDSSTETVRTLIAINPNLMIGSSESFLAKNIPPETQSVIFGGLKLFGLCAFIKGVYIAKDVGQVINGTRTGMGKVLSHMFGGAILLNIPKFSCFISAVTGLPYICITGG